MLYQSYIISLAAVALLGWGSWVVVITKLSPFASPQISLSFFYASFFVALAATFALILYFWRLWKSKGEIFSTHLNMSIRQGALISAMVSIGLAFQRFRVLTWWDALLLLAVIVLIEFYFMAKR